MQKRYIGTDELAVYLDISINTIYSWVFMRKIPFVKMGSRVKFDLQEIDNWVSKRKFHPEN
jgi:excisionase family DNA binding protein